MNTDYTLILNYYNKTEELLNKQLDRVFSQSLPPKYIIGCFLGLPNEKSNFMKVWLDRTKNMNNVYTAYSDLNFKHIGRYQVALSAPTEKIITLDDDRFPKPDYCRAMVSILHHENCLVQNYGWILDRSETYKYINRQPDFNEESSLVFKGIADMSGTYYSLKNHRDPGKPMLKKVDYLCGGMAFNRSSLKYLFAEDITDDIRLIGDDIAFCLRASKNGIPIYAYRPQDNEEGDRRSLEHDSAGINPTATSQKFWEIRTQMLHKELGYPWGEDFSKKYSEIKDIL